jgi:hypothetical protein
MNDIQPIEHWPKPSDEIVEMSDNRFLDYCAHMTETPRCGFSSYGLSRLLRLAGFPNLGRFLEQTPNGIWSHMHGEVRVLVALARGGEVAEI